MLSALALGVRRMRTLVSRISSVTCSGTIRIIASRIEIRARGRSVHLMRRSGT